jgi:hypothetical protein
VDVVSRGVVSILRRTRVTPANPRPAYVTDFAIRIGQRATLVASSGARAYGTLMALSHSGLEKLYASPGFEQYRPEAILATTLDGLPVPALCNNLREEPPPGDGNPEYATRLQARLRSLGFPREYIDSIS